MTEISRKLKQTKGFFREAVWQDPSGTGRPRTFLIYTLRVLLITFKGLGDQMILLRASALSYSTLFALVPVLAVGFAMLKGLGVQSEIEETLLKYLTAEQEEVARQITTYIANTDFRALGAFGTGFLIVAVIMMLSNVEGTFNTIWGVTRSRSLSRKVSDYISVLVLGPLLLVISTTLVSSISTNTLVQLLSKYPIIQNLIFVFQALVSLAGVWIAFTAMYLLMPNTRVRFFPALIAGLVCGTLWELAFFVYTDFYVGIVSYNKIYGTFAVLPIFLIWLFISWLIVLIGAIMSNAIQQIPYYQREQQEVDPSIEENELMALYITLNIARRFSRGEPPLGAEQLSSRLAIPLRIIRKVLDQMAVSGILQEIGCEEPLYQPFHDPRLIRLSDINDAVRRSGGCNWQLPDDEKDENLERLIGYLREEASRRLGSETLQDLVTGKRSE